MMDDSVDWSPELSKLRPKRARIETIEWRAGSGAPSNAQQTWTEGCGFRLIIEDQDGVGAIGECMPLPGYSSSTMDSVRSRLDQVEAQPSSLAALIHERPSSYGPADASYCPEADFAIETAMLDLLGRRMRQPLWRLLAPHSTPPTRVPNAAALPGAHLAQNQQLARDWARGVQTFKMKIGYPGQFEQEFFTARTLLTGAPPTMELRLDANTNLTPGQFSRLAQLRLEFVEEPVTPEHWHALADMPTAWAVDESVARSPHPSETLRRAGNFGCDHLVVKPAALGLLHARDLAMQARAAGIHVIVSHMMDGPIARCAAANLALAIADSRHAMGLGRHVASDAWPGQTPTWITDAEIVCHQGAGLGLRACPTTE